MSRLFSAFRNFLLFALFSCSSRSRSSHALFGSSPSFCCAWDTDEKCRFYTIALLAVLRSGAAAIGLETGYPDKRLNDIVDFVTAKLILASHVQASRFNHDHIELSDQLLDSITLEGEDQTIDMATPSSAALGILTSGSTGTPKTTIIEHRHYVSGAFAHAASIDLSSDSRVLQFASHSFDVSMLEILTTLMFGGTVCVPHQDGRLETSSRQSTKAALRWPSSRPPS